MDIGIISNSLLLRYSSLPVMGYKSKHTTLRWLHIVGRWSSYIWRYEHSLVLVFELRDLIDHGLDDFEVYGTCLGHHGVRFFSQNRRDFDDLVFNLLPLQASEVRGRARMIALAAWRALSGVRIFLQEIATYSLLARTAPEVLYQVPGTAVYYSYSMIQSISYCSPL